jgi:biopolymer transport protein ExbB/TolQ
MSEISFENRLIELRSRALSAEDDEEVHRLAEELRQMLHERIEQLRSRLVLTALASALAPDRSKRP